MAFTLAELVKAQHEALKAHDEHTLQVVGDAYRGLRSTLEDEAQRLSNLMARATARGAEINTSWLVREGQLNQMIDTIQREIVLANEGAYQGTVSAQAQALHLAAQEQSKLLAAQVDTKIFQPSIAALTNQIVGATADGSPLRALFDAIPGDAGAAMRDALIQGVATGMNPLDVANLVRNFDGISQSRAETIARTEMLRSYREASDATYQANADVMQGWIWSAELDDTTCAECWAMDGTQHSVDESLDGHPSCRCAQLPVTNDSTWPDLYGTGVEKFDQLPPADQLDILGPAKYAAYDSGEISLPDVVGRSSDPDWGTMRYERSLSEILADDPSANADWRLGTGFTAANVGAPNS